MTRRRRRFGLMIYLWHNDQGERSIWMDVLWTLLLILAIVALVLYILGHRR